MGSFVKFDGTTEHSMETVETAEHTFNRRPTGMKLKYCEITGDKTMFLKKDAFPNYGMEMITSNYHACR